MLVMQKEGEMDGVLVVGSGMRERFGSKSERVLFVQGRDQKKKYVQCQWEERSKAEEKEERKRGKSVAKRKGWKEGKEGKKGQIDRRVMRYGYGRGYVIEEDEG